MNSGGHINFAVYSVAIFAAGYIASKQNIDSTSFEVICGVFIGCLLPDIDHPKATLGKFSPIPILNKLFKMINIHIFRHGCITHTLLVNLVLAGLYYYYRHDIWLGISFGYFTHLYIDDVTGNKLPMLWFPFKIKNKKENKNV